MASSKIVIFETFEKLLSRCSSLEAQLLKYEENYEQLKQEFSSAVDSSIVEQSASELLAEQCFFLSRMLHDSKAEEEELRWRVKNYEEKVTELSNNCLFFESTANEMRENHAKEMTKVVAILMVLF